MSKIKTLLVLIPFLAGMLFNPIQITAGSPNFIVAPASESNCNLPAPTGLQVVDVTPTSIEVAWNAVPGAVEYYIEARDAGNNTLYYSNTTANLSEVCSGLPSNTAITISVWASCGQGNVSPNRSSITESTELVIIDVLAGGYSPCNNNSTLPSSNYYELDLAKIYEGFIFNDENEKICSFNAKVLVNGIRLSDNSDDEQIELAEEGGSVIFRYKLQPENIIARFSANPQYNGNCTLNITHIEHFVSLEMNECEGRDEGEGKSRGVQNENKFSTNYPKIFPNPTRNDINIIFEDTLDLENVQIELFRLDGTNVTTNISASSTNRIVSIDLGSTPPNAYILKVLTPSSQYIQIVHKL